MFFGIGNKMHPGSSKTPGSTLSWEIHICLALNAPFDLDFYVFRYRGKLDPGSRKKPDSKFVLGYPPVSCSEGPF